MSQTGLAFRLWRRLLRWVSRLARPRHAQQGRVGRGVRYTVHSRVVDDPVSTEPVFADPVLAEDLGESLDPHLEVLSEVRLRAEARLREGAVLHPLAESCRRGAWISARIRDQDGQDVARLALWPAEGEPSP